MLIFGQGTDYYILMMFWIQQTVTPQLLSSAQSLTPHPCQVSKRGFVFITLTKPA